MSKPTMKPALVSFPSQSLSSKLKAVPDAQLNFALMIIVFVSTENIRGNVIPPPIDLFSSLFDCRTANETEVAGFARKI